MRAEKTLYGVMLAASFAVISCQVGQTTVATRNISATTKVLNGDPAALWKQAGIATDAEAALLILAAGGEARSFAVSSLNGDAEASRAVDAREAPGCLKHIAHETTEGIDQYFRDLAAAANGNEARKAAHAAAYRIRQAEGRCSEEIRTTVSAIARDE